MAKLYLLRHAQAASFLNGDDKDRMLTAHGIEQAKEVAKYIIDVDLALCSGAKRTQMTLENAVQAGANIKKTDILDSLYNAPAGDLLNAIHSCADQNILVIAHNPGIHILAKTLTGRGEETQIEKLNIFYNPATLSIFDCDINNWADLKPQENTLVDLIIPD